MVMGRGMVLAAAVAFGGMVAMMTVMMACGVMGPGMMHNRGASTVPQTPVASESGEFTIEIRDLAFWPNDLTVEAGTRVTWVNRDDVPHDATADDKAWKTELLSKGDEESLTFDRPGAYSYYCTVHPQMRANLTVQ